MEAEEERKVRMEEGLEASFQDFKVMRKSQRKSSVQTAKRGKIVELMDFKNDCNLFHVANPFVALQTLLIGSAEGFVNELSSKAHELLLLFDDQIIIDEVSPGSK